MRNGEGSRLLTGVSVQSGDKPQTPVQAQEEQVLHTLNIHAPLRGPRTGKDPEKGHLISHPSPAPLSTLQHAFATLPPIRAFFTYRQATSLFFVSRGWGDVGRIDILDCNVFGRRGRSRCLALSFGHFEVILCEGTGREVVGRREGG